MSETPFSEGMTEAALRALAHKELQFRKKQQEVADGKKAHRNHVKTFGVDLKDFDAAIAQMLAEDGGDLFVKKLASQHRLMKLLDLPVAKRFAAGDQLKLDLEETGKKNDRSNGVSKQFRDGARSHIDGLEEKDNPHAANSEEGQDWLEGYRYSVDLCTVGSKELDRILKGLPKEGEAAKGTLSAKAPRASKTFGGETVKVGKAAEDVVASLDKGRAENKKAAKKRAPKKKTAE